MTGGNKSAFAVGLIGAFAVGVAAGTFVNFRGDRFSASPAPAVEISAPAVEVTSPPAVGAPDTTAPAPKAVREAPRMKAPPPTGAKPAARPVPAMAASAPEVGVRLKPVLNRGANMKMAADGFRDAEEFATVAHAARNTKVPFMVLKHHVLEEKQTLAAALRSANPALDGIAESRLARSQARADLEALRTMSSN